MPLPKPNPFMPQEPKQMPELKSTSVASSKLSLVMHQPLLPPMSSPPKPHLNLVDWFNTLPRSNLIKPIKLKGEEVLTNIVSVSQKPQLATHSSKPAMITLPKTKQDKPIQPPPTIPKEQGGGELDDSTPLLTSP